MGGYRCGPEDQISVPAVLKIAAACGALQTLTLNARYEIPSTKPAMRRNTRDTIAAALSHLPSSVQSVQYIGDSPHNFEAENYTRLLPMSFRKQDMLCMALHKISMQLRHLHIDDEAVFPELFCPDGGLLHTQWPYLETLHLDRIDDCSDFSAIARYADGSASDDTLLERYSDDIYTNAGNAAQRMPRLEDLVVEFHGHELSFGYESGKWVLAILMYGGDTYVPSSRVLEAWKVPGRQLEFCPSSRTLDAIYTSWPPI